MVEYYDIILLIPLILTGVLKIFGLISTENAFLYWISFLFASILYAVYEEGFFAGLTLIGTFIFFKLIFKTLSKIKDKMTNNSNVNCIALYTEGNSAQFFDGRKRFEKNIDFGTIIIPGEIYIIKKNN